MKTAVPTRPVIRYHGGKWHHAPWVISQMPEHRRYVEPFMGAASVLMRKPRSHAEVINDMDGEIVNLFKVLRDCGAELREKLRLTPFARAEFEEAWMPTECPVERARKIVIRSFFGFGSQAATRPGGKARTGFRSISDRSGTTPAHDWMNYPNCMESIIQRLRGVVIENRPAVEVIQRHDKGDVLFYVDPPYVMDSRTDNDPDYRHEKTDEDHEQLAHVLKQVKGKVMLAGYHSKLYDRLFAGWPRVERAAFADGSKPRTEVMWMNFEPEGLLL